MTRVVVLGAGTAGTMLVNRLRRRAPADWQIQVVEQSAAHHYQPGYLFLPFGASDVADLVRPTARLISPGVELVRAEVDSVQADHNQVVTADGSVLPYDCLVVATGTQPRPDQTPGLLDGGEWRRSIHEFYTLEGAVALRQRLASFSGGRLVVHVTEMPIKCPVAPLEFAFLADSYFAERGQQDSVELTYVTPLSGAFTRPIASASLGGMLDRRNISLEADFVVERVDAERHELVSYDDRVVPFDLLVTVPVNMGADFVGRSGLGDELNYVRVDKHTLQSTSFENVFAIGDAADLPTSKAGSTAHFAVDTVVSNLLGYAAGGTLTDSFDGHANCYVEAGRRRAMLLDFNYDTEPLPGRYPIPHAGPFRLLEESRLNHLGKLAFRWAYWHVLLPGRPIPLPARMSLAGKQQARQEV